MVFFELANYYQPQPNLHSQDTVCPGPEGVSWMKVPQYVFAQNDWNNNLEIGFANS